MALHTSVPAESFADQRGKLRAFEFRLLPFMPARIYVISEVPENESRGGHAHRKLQQAFMCLSGSVDLSLDNGTERESVHLVSGGPLTIIGPYTWRELHNFNKNTVLLVMASLEYDESDYVRDREVFLSEISNGE